MDEILMRRLSWLALLLVAPMTWASGALRDPTQPPASFAAGTADTGAYGGAVRLEAIRQGRNGQAEALIGGQWLKVGAEVQGAKIVSIGRDEVVLRSASGQEALRLAPGVDKVQVRRPIGGQSSAKGGV